jgi:enoyl-CoA hydratase/carnithine racemase
MSESERTEPLLFERIDAHVVLLTLNRPEVRNAINGAVARGLEAAVEQVERDEDIRVAILAATGDKSFCAGADLSEVAAGRTADLMTERGGFAGFVRAKRSKPWIAAVDALCLGGGLEVSLACDMIVAGENASFGLPEVKRGIFAGAGGAFRLPRAVPRALAIEMIATGEPIGAHRAFECGLVNRLVPAGQALAAARRLAASIAANAPLAVRRSLELARAAADLDEPALWDLSARIGREIVASDDAREGPRAFLEKRPPRWTGR